MLSLTPLLADIPLKVIFYLVVGVIWAIGAIAGWQKKKQAQARRNLDEANPQRRFGQPPAENEDDEAAAATVVTGNPAIDREIEVFLQQARQQEAPAAPAPPTPPRRKRPKPQRRESELETTYAGDERPMGESVSRRVARDLDNRGFQDRAEHLTTVDRAAAEVEDRVKNKFDHQVGSLSMSAAGSAPSSAATIEADVPSAAAGLAALLADPQSVRQAIVLQEIMRRPEERW